MEGKIQMGCRPAFRWILPDMISRVLLSGGDEDFDPIDGRALRVSIPRGSVLVRRVLSRFLGGAAGSKGKGSPDTSAHLAQKAVEDKPHSKTLSR